MVLDSAQNKYPTAHAEVLNTKKSSLAISVIHVVKHNHLPLTPPLRALRS